MNMNLDSIYDELRQRNDLQINLNDKVDVLIEVLQQISGDLTHLVIKEVTK